MRTAKGERKDVKPSRAPQWYANATAARAAIAKKGIRISEAQWQEWTLDVLRREHPDATEQELAEGFGP